MNFDEAIKYAKDYSFVQSYEYEYDYNLVTDLDDVIELLEKLRQEYAPTVEMTKGQAKTILGPEEGKNITDLLTDEVPNFDYLFWEPLTDKQVVQAWLNPETIVVTDSE